MFRLQEENVLLDSNANNAELNNLYFLHNLADKTGGNPIPLGSKSGAFLGTYDDLAYYIWDGTNLQFFDFSRKGGGKSVRGKNFAYWLNKFYGVPVLAFDRQAENLNAVFPATHPIGVKNLKAFGIEPDGLKKKFVGLMPARLAIKDRETSEYKDEYPNTRVWGLDWLDFQQLPHTVALQAYEQMLDIEAFTETSKDKYNAALNVLELVLNDNKPRDSHEILELVVEYNETLSESRKTILLERKIKSAIAGQALDADYSVNFKDLVKQGKWINVITSLKAATDNYLQIYEVFLHYLFYFWRREGKIPPILYISEEHDLVSGRGTEKNPLKETYEHTGTKDRKAGNLYYKITQNPDRIPYIEIEQADAIILTRPRDPDFAKLLKAINEDVFTVEAAKHLNWNDSVKVQQCGLATAKTFTRYYPFYAPCACHEERAENRLLPITLKKTSALIAPITERKQDFAFVKEKRGY